MFRAAKTAKPFAVIDNALSQTFADSGQCFQFVRCSGVDVYSLRT